MISKKDKYHNWLRGILNSFSNDNSKKLIKNNNCIKLSSIKSGSKNMMEYRPDYSFKFKTGKKSFEYIILEFLDTESYEGIISDIVECACVKNCRILLFLSLNPEKHKESENITNVICDFLDEINGENVLDVVNLHVPFEMDENKIKIEIFHEINKRIKLPK